MGATCGARATDDRYQAPHFYCAKKQTSWTRIWLAVTDLFPGIVDCWSDNIRLVYSSANGGSYSEPEGVQTRVPGFGNTSTIENLDPSIPGGAGAYFSHMVDMLVSKGGLQRGVSVRGAPYDFRRAPTPEYVASLKTLIEDTSVGNGNQRVVLVSVSLSSEGRGGVLVVVCVCVGGGGGKGKVERERQRVEARKGEASSSPHTSPNSTRWDASTLSASSP